MVKKQQNMLIKIYNQWQVQHSQTFPSACIVTLLGAHDKTPTPYKASWLT